MIATMPSVLEYESSAPAPPLPKAVSAIAALYITIGLLSAHGMGSSLARDRVSIDFNVLSIFVGLGLLCRVPGWRGFVMVIAWIGMSMMPLMAFLFVRIPEKMRVHFDGRPLDLTPSAQLALGLSVCATVFILCLWQYLVLRRPEIKALFIDQPEQKREGPPARPDWIRSRRLWFVLALLTFVSGWLSGRWVQSRSPANARQGTRAPVFIVDRQRNVGMFDSAINAVGIAANVFPGFSYSPVSGGFVLNSKEPNASYTIPVERDTLCILLPDGSIDRFRLRPEFVSRFEARTASGSSDNYVRICAELLEDPLEKAKLERLLASYEEPRPATRPANGAGH
jgi:hypothetical protein